MMSDKKNLTVSICIPSLATWDADFAMCLIQLILTGNQPLLEGVEDQRIYFHNLKGSILPRSREKLVEMSLQEGATHILFLDSDMIFPAWTLQCLLARSVPVVAANCPTKQIPAFPTARRLGNDFRGDPVYTHPDFVTEENELEEVWRVGTGIMLIEASVFTHLPKPWFSNRWEPKLQDHVGEDWFFCELLEAAGVKLYVDHRVSAQISHVGQLHYDHTLVEVPEKSPEKKLILPH